MKTWSSSQTHVLRSLCMLIISSAMRKLKEIRTAAHLPAHNASSSYSISTTRSNSTISSFQSICAPTAFPLHSIPTPQHVLMLTDRHCGSTCTQFVMHLSEYRLVPVVGLGGEVFSTCVPFNCASHTCGYVANSDVMQCSYKSENPTPFIHIGTPISLPLIVGYSHNIANITAFLNFKILPHDMLLLHSSSCDCFTVAKILRWLESSPEFRVLSWLIGSFWSLPASCR